ncbi:MAG TPA: site-specific integrase, partial [Terriglobia bacterium]|nr:site-specific integrase [Terriglobia bacterium]
VKNLTAPKVGSRIFWDSELKGFGVRITAAGVISFILDYRVNGRQRRYTIGRNPEWTSEAARTEAASLKPRISKGYDPLQEKERARGEPTIAELAEEYLERHSIPNKRAGSLRNDRQMLEGIVKPRLGKLRVAAVGRRDIENLHQSLKATPYQANRVLALVSHMFGKAIEWKWAAGNPARGIPRYHEDRRERWLTEDEMHAFTQALDSYSDQNAANALRLLLLTGAREGEVLKADWSEFDLERAVWSKPSHHTKQKKLEHVPLSITAVDLLRKMGGEDATGPLFPGRYGKGARVTLRRPWVQACKAAGLAEAITKKGKRRMVTRWKPTLRIHDLRHSFASHLVSRGTSLQIVGRLIGHTQVATTMRYAHLADSALRDATNIFGDVFAAAAKPKKKADVLIIHKKGSVTDGKRKVLEIGR